MDFPRVGVILTLQTDIVSFGLVRTESYQRVALRANNQVMNCSLNILI
jgi:hypothetical protein